jgi:hypothetical protein
VVTYDGDSKFYRRYSVNPGQGLKGVIYVRRDAETPESVMIVFTEAKEEPARAPGDKREGKK